MEAFRSGKITAFRLGVMLVYYSICCVVDLVSLYCAKKSIYTWDCVGL